jgi:2,5-furandicarboxylate decarboxylase 1
MAYQDLESFLNHVEKTEGELIRITEEMSPCLELVAVLKRIGTEGGPAVLFERISGFKDFRVAGNVLGTKKRLAMAMGVTEADLEKEYLERRQRLLAPKKVKTGPVKEVVKKRNVDLTKDIPNVVHHAKDAGGYFSAGVLITKDIETGVQSMGIHRLQIQGKNRLGVLLHSPPLSEYFAKAEAAGVPLDCAVACGVEPTILSASVAKAGMGTDKLAMVGGLSGQPVKVVRGETVDINVPAFAELVVEGRLLPKVRAEEGPFGESTGCYLTYQSPVIEVTAITRRKRAIFEIIEPWGMEGEVLGYLGYGSEMLRQLKELVPNMVAFHLIPHTCSSHAVASVNERGRKDARRLLYLILTLFPGVKKATVVDTDVNMHDPYEVEWAVATRFQADRDLLVLNDVPGLGIDPSSRAGRSSKIGLDATIPAEEPEKFEKIWVNEASDKKAKKVLGKYLRA